MVRRTVAGLAICFALISFAACASDKAQQGCAGIGLLGGPVQSTPADALRSYLDQRLAPVGDKTDQSNWSEFSSTTQQVVYEETSPLPSPTNAAGDALVGRIYVTTASDGWQVTGGCVN